MKIHRLLFIFVFIFLINAWDQKRYKGIDICFNVIFSLCTIVTVATILYRFYLYFID